MARSLLRTLADIFSYKKYIHVIVYYLHILNKHQQGSRSSHVYHFFLCFWLYFYLIAKWFISFLALSAISRDIHRTYDVSWLIDKSAHTNYSFKICQIINSIKSGRLLLFELQVSLLFKWLSFLKITNFWKSCLNWDVILREFLWFK